jgi:hypothetical protein
VFTVIILIVFVGYFYAVGGGQATAGLQYQATSGIQALFQSFAFRSFSNFLKNPFGVAPQAAQVEEVQTGTTVSTTAPNQAFSVEIRKMIDTVQFDQKSLSFVITFKNDGGSRIERATVKVYSKEPARGCLRFDSNQLPSDGSCKVKGDSNNEVVCNVESVGAYSQKEIVLTGVSVSSSCVSAALLMPLKPTVQTPIFVNVEAATYYPTSSRLTVERIKTDYGTLLFKNQILLPQPTGAITRAGSAMTINLDMGDQPILDTVAQGGLIMNWMNTGAGQMDSSKNPFLFIVTPGNFGQCISTGLGSNTIIIKNTKVTTGDCIDSASAAAKTCTSSLISKIGSDTCGARYCSVNDVCYSALENTIADWKYDPSLKANESFGLNAIAAARECNVACCTGMTGSELTTCKKSYEDCITRMKSEVQDCYNNSDQYYSSCAKIVDVFTNGDKTTVCSGIDIKEGDTKCVVCDSALVETWCNFNSPIYQKVENDTPSMKPVFDWVCKKALETGWTPDKYHVCATNGLTAEFNIFTCPLSLCSVNNANYDKNGCVKDEGTILTNENRVTQYITAIALYPYKTETSTQIQAYCTEGSC